MSQKQNLPEKKPGVGGAGGFEGEESKVGSDAQQLAKKSEKLLGKVNVVCGAHDLDMELAGLTVSEITVALHDFLNVDDSMEVYVDGNLVTDKGNFKLKTGQRVEFMKEAGQKG